MSDRIDEQIVRDTAALAKLELNDCELKQAGEDMASMLTYIDRLKELSTEEIEPMIHIFDRENVFREDLVINGDSSQAMLANAPAQDKGQYQVPKTVE